MSWLDLLTIAAVAATLGMYEYKGVSMFSRLWTFITEEKSVTPVPSPDVPRPTPVPAPPGEPLADAKLTEIKDLLLRAGRLLLDTGNGDEAAKVFDLLVEISSGGKT